MLFAVPASLAGWGVAMEVSQVPTWLGSASTPSQLPGQPRAMAVALGGSRGNLPQPQPGSSGATCCQR